MRLTQDPGSNEEMRDELAQAWWAARYYYADKKKTQTMDRFIWFLLNLSSLTWGAIKGKRLVKAYQEAFLTPEMERAMALEDRLEIELYDACATYVETINPSPTVFGISTGKTLAGDELMMRVADIVGGKLIPGIYSECGQLDYADVLVRSLWKGAEAVYPHIVPVLEAKVGEYKDESMREFVLHAVQK